MSLYMMKRLFIVSVIFGLMTGCVKNLTPVNSAVTVIVVTATPKPTDTPIPALDAETRATLAAEYIISTPTIRSGFPTPISSTPSDIQRGISFYELYIGKYVVRRWSSDQYSPFFSYTISALDQTEIRTPLISEVEPGNGLDPLTGIDITGEGNPDAIFHLYTGGNHCCHNVQVYDLGKTAKKVFELGTGDCPGTFIDLNGDGVYEYETCDITFASIDITLSGFPCSYADAPYPKAVFQYSIEQGYTSSNLQFASHYEDAIVFHNELLEKYRQNPSTAVENNYSICDVSKLVLDYLYSGQTEKAWEVLYQIYPADIAEQYRGIIEKGLENNPFYDSP